MAKVLIATEKPFAKVAVDGIREVVEGAGYELALLEKYTDKAQLLEAVADAEGLTVSDDDYDHELGRMAEMYQMEKDKLKDLVGDYEKEQITEDLKIQKAVDFVVDNAKESKPKTTKKKEEE